MPEIQVEIVIQRSKAAVFDLIADLPHYNRWLEPSSLYRGVTVYSELPVRLGTQYADQGKLTRMEGRVVAYDPPKQITFRQSSIAVAGGLDVEIEYTLKPEGSGTRVTRHVKYVTFGGFLLLQPFAGGAIRGESERILMAMQAWLERK